MRTKSRFFILHPISNQMEKLQILVVFLILLSPNTFLGFSQSLNDPIRVVQTVEEKSITLYNNVGVASAPAGTRIVIVLMDPADQNRYIDQDCIWLMNGTKQIDCQALGDYKKGFFTNQLGIPFIRNNATFEGSRGTVIINEENLAAAFVVSNAVSLNSLSLLYSYLGKIIDLDTVISVELMDGIHLKIKEFTVYPEATITKHDAVDVVINIKNDSSNPFSITENTFRLGVPIYASRADEPDWGWDELNNLLKYFNDDTPDIKHTSLSVTIPPSESRNIELLYETGKFSSQWSKLGYFKYFMVPLL